MPNAITGDCVFSGKVYATVGTYLPKYKRLLLQPAELLKSDEKIFFELDASDTTFYGATAAFYPKRNASFKFGKDVQLVGKIPAGCVKCSRNQYGEHEVNKNFIGCYAILDNFAIPVMKGDLHNDLLIEYDQTKFSFWYKLAAYKEDIKFAKEIYRQRLDSNGFSRN